MSKITAELANAAYRSDFPAFARKSFEVLNPTVLWKNNWHLRATCFQLEKVRLGLCKRLIITLPPRCLKSHLGSIAWPAYMLGRDPTKKVVCISYSQELAGKHAADFRRLIESPWYRRLFPNVRLNRSTASEIETDQGGSRLTTSIEGTLTGRGGDPIIIDDAMNANDGYSKAAREAVNKWFATTLVSRLDDPSAGAIVVIMQRLHEDDLVGHLVKLGHWEVLNLPAIAPDDREVALSDHEKYLWKKGELLHEDRLSMSTLQHLKQQMGGDVFNAQFLQTPVPETGNALNRNWLKYYENAPVLQQGDHVVQSWDTAMKTGDDNDYSACLTFLIRSKNEYYLLDAFRKRLEFHDLLKVVLPHAQRFRATTVLIEEQVSGIPFVQMAKNMGVQGVLGIRHRTDKQTRMRSAIPKIEGGSLFLCKSAPWLEDFLLEYLAFPKGTHDDQMDAMSQFLNWCVNGEGSVFDFDFGHDDDLGAPDSDSIAWSLRRH
jgi:predicted phage terminase large subunit-like protein